MRYSYYVQIRRMSETLKEAAVYLLGCDDEKEQQMLLQNSREMARVLQRVTAEDREASETYTLLRRIRQGCDSALEDIRREEIKGKIAALAQLTDALCRVIENIPYKIKVVFLAELGEKWDSMYSVYKAFQERKDCDVSVVLTPVFRVVQQDGKQKQDVIYRDFLTQLGIPFIDYRKYHMKKDCPDLVFMTQPYESCSLPEFWPETIAQISRLVYIPYFTAALVHQNSVNTWCNLPVHYKAWRIICQSDRMKDFFEKNSKPNRSKALPLGLPAWDEIIRVRKEGLSEKERDPAIEEKLAGRKIVLWNSHFDTVNSSLRLAKDIIQFFSDNPDICLLWRRHPMTDTILKLYSPEQFSKEIRELYKVVDDSPNMMMDTNSLYTSAFHYADAMISDYSSLIPLFLLMDKPVLWLFHNSWQFTEKIINNNWVEKADSLNDIKSFCERIQNNIDLNKGRRKRVIQSDVSLADGNCGKRVCDTVIQEMIDEDFHNG